MSRLEAAGLTPSKVNRMDQQLRNAYQEINRLVNETTDVEPWNSSAYFETFQSEFLQRSESTCALAHHWALRVGNSLLDKVDAKTITADETKLLYQIAYDIEIVHLRRYDHGYPNTTLWYNDEQQQASKEFLERFKHGRAVVEDSFPDYPMPWRTVITQMEIGPVAAPPFANIHIDSVTATKSPPQTPNDSTDQPQEFEITLQGSVRGLLPVGSETWEMPEINRTQMQDMKDLAKELRDVELLTLKIEHLVQQQISSGIRENAHYVSPFELMDLIEELRVTNDNIRMRAQRLSPDLNPNQLIDRSASRVQGRNVKVTSSVQDVKVYLEGLNRAANHSKTLLTTVRGVAESVGRTDIVQSSDSVLAKLKPLLAQRDKYLEIARDISKVSEGDLDTIGERTRDLGDYLIKLANAVESSAEESKANQKSLVDYLFELRGSAWKENRETTEWIANWEKSRSGIFDSISELLSDASWLRSAGQHAKSVGTVLRFGGKVRGLVSEMNASFKRLDEEILEQGTKDMLLGLKMTGEIMALVAECVPDRVMSYGVELYARLLRQIDEVGIAWYKLQLRKTQGQLDVRYGGPIKAYTGIIESAERYGLDDLFLFNDVLATQNKLNERLVTSTGIDPDAADLRLPRFTKRMWMVMVDSIGKEGVGFMELSREQKVSLCNICAWHWRVYQRPVDREDLADLLVLQETIIDGQHVRLDDLELAGQAALTRLAWQKYLSRFASLAPRDTQEQRMARELLETATAAFTAQGFLLHREDVYQLLKALRNSERSFAGFGSRRLPMDGDRPAIVTKLLRAKEKIREQERKRAWRAVLQMGPAGLTLNDIRLKFTEAIKGQGTNRYTNFQHKPEQTKFTIKRKASIPRGQHGKFAYSGLVWIENHFSTTCDFGTVLSVSPPATEPEPTNIAGDPDMTPQGVVRGGLDSNKIQEIKKYWKDLQWTIDFTAPAMSLNIETGEISPKRFVFQCEMDSVDGLKEIHRITQTIVGRPVKGPASYFEGLSWSGTRKWEMEWFDKQGKRTHQSSGEGKWRAYQKDDVWFLSTGNSVAPIYGDIQFRLDGNTAGADSPDRR